MANGGTDRAKNDTLPEPAMTPSSNVKFGPQGTLEHTVTRRRFNGVKSSQAHQRILNPGKRLLFVIRPRRVLALFTQQRLQQCSGRGALGRPRIGLLDSADHRVQPVDERHQPFAVDNCRSAAGADRQQSRTALRLGAW